MLLEAQNVSKAFGGFLAVAGADLAVRKARSSASSARTAPASRPSSTASPATRAERGAHPVRRRRRHARSPEAHARVGIGRTFQVPATFEDMTHPRERHGRRLPAPSARRDAREHARRIVELTGLGQTSRALARHARPQAPGDRARARERAAPHAARRGAGRADPGRDPARDRAGAPHPWHRRHPRHRRAHHGGDPDAGPARPGVQPGPRHRQRQAARTWSTTPR